MDMLPPVMLTPPEMLLVLSVMSAPAWKE